MLLPPLHMFLAPAMEGAELMAGTCSEMSGFKMRRTRSLASAVLRAEMLAP